MELAESSSSVTSHHGPVAFPARDADRTVVWLRGEHDICTVAALSQILARAIALDDGDLVVDLSGVQFMDAATVGVILRARDFLRLQSRSVALRSPSPCAARVLDLCELGDLLEPGPEHATAAPGAGCARRAGGGADSRSRRCRRGRGRRIGGSARARPSWRRCAPRPPPTRRTHECSPPIARQEGRRPFEDRPHRRGAPGSRGPLTASADTGQRIADEQRTGARSVTHAMPAAHRSRETRTHRGEIGDPRDAGGPQVRDTRTPRALLRRLIRLVQTRRAVDRHAALG